jgi:hypothetical protein
MHCHDRSLHGFCTREPRLTRCLQEAARAKDPPHPLNFVALNRIALGRPSAFRSGSGDSDASSDVSALILSQGLNHHPAHEVPSRPHTALARPPPASAGALAAVRPATAGALQGARSQAPRRVGVAFEEEARPSASGAAETIARLFGRKTVDSNVEAGPTRQEVVARVRARPGSGGSPTSRCDTFALPVALARCSSHASRSACRPCLTHTRSLRPVTHLLMSTCALCSGMFMLDAAQRAAVEAARHAAARRRRERLELQRRGANLTVLRCTMAKPDDSHAEYVKRKEFQIAAKAWMVLAEVATRLTTIRVRRSGWQLG